MFTGLVQSLGTVRSRDRYQLEITCTPEGITAIVPTLEIGDSVAVDGVCLTVETIGDRGFVAAASPETLRRTSLAQREATGTWVNLETSLRAGSKIGGHFVTGHVDGVGELLAIAQSGTSWELDFAAPSTVARYIVPKGSIAINGISLTVAECHPQGTWFRAAVIPHTYAATNLQHLAIGSPVNLEGDILGKYVERLLAGDRSNNAAADPAAHDPSNGTAEPPATITPEFLLEHGYH